MIGDESETGKATVAPGDDVRVSGIRIEWNVREGTCTFEGLPVAMMWVDTTLMGLMSGVQTMVGTERFGLAQQSEGRRSVEADWEIISCFPTFAEGFEAIANIAAVAGWGVWKLASIDEANKTCRFRVWNSWEGRYQAAMGVCWGSGMLAGKLAGYCSKLFGTNCWTMQTSYIARGDAFDEFEVAPSENTIERELENLLATDEATRADMAVALSRLRSEVAERERAETALRKSEERYRAIVEDQTELICRFLPDGTLTFVNEACCRYFGRRREELVGQSFMPFVPDDDRAPVSEHLASFGPQSPVATHEHKVLLSNGNVRWHQWTNRAIFDGAKIVEFQGVGRDITDRKRAEEERARLEDQLRQSQKMEAIGRLAGGVAHDFNNLLTSIRGFAEVIQKSLPESDPLRADAREICHASDRAAGLTSQLLACSRKQLIHPKVIKPDRVIEASQNMLGRIIGEDIHLVFRPGATPWCIRADPAQLDQVLLNLVVNARDAMRTGGRLAIETAKVTLNEANCRDHSAIEPGDYVTLSVSDTGSGMDEVTKDHIFEPFFSTKQDNGGTGLGLATVYGIVKQNAGGIEVQSEPGHGTAFVIYFPRAFEQAEDRNVSGGRAAVGGSETILLVEDDAMVRTLVRRILSSQGYTVLESDGGTRALAIAARHEGEVHLLLTDVIMPNMNGRQLYEGLKRKRPDLRAVFMSGYTNDVIDHHGVLSPDVHFVPKPFSNESLLKTVREALDG